MIDAGILNDIRAYGLDPRPEQLMPGRGFQRCPDTEKVGDTDSGWVVVNRLSSGRVLARYGSWIRGDKQSSTGGNTAPLSDEDKAEVAAQSEQYKVQRSVNARITAREAAWIWDKEATPIQGNGHGYLRKKGVPSFGLREVKGGSPYQKRGYRNRLLVPVHKLCGDLVGLQRIDWRGDKRYSANADMSEASFVIGSLDDGV